MGQTMKHNFSLFLIFSILLCAAPPTLVAQGGTAEPLSCADHSITARAVRSPEGVEAFVQCAYEFVQEVGFEEARRAFNEDERWKSGTIYVFVDEVTPMSDMSRSFVFPPDPSREGLPWGLLIDAFGNDWYREQHRIVNSAGDGWIYYSFTNPATGRDEPKASYLKSIDWDGALATIGAGVYRRDLPGTCRSEEVNAMELDADPSKEKLREFVRCAAMELESQGFFTVRSLTTDPHWGNGSIYLFGVDAYGISLFTGDPFSRLYGASELDPYINTSLEGQDLVGVGDAFGESFLYYSAVNPSTRRLERKVTFVKRVVVYGLPILVGSGIYTDCPPGGCDGASEPTDALTFTFDRGPQGFFAGFADYPPADAEFYVDFRLPRPPAPAGVALRPVHLRSQPERRSLHVLQRTHRRPVARRALQRHRQRGNRHQHAGRVYRCRRPAGREWIKAGATRRTASGQRRLLPADEHRHRQSVRAGGQAVVLGNIANSRNCEQSRQWERKSFQGRPTPVPISIPSNGQAWLLFGADSGFEARTEIYFTRAAVTFTPM